MYSEGLLLKFDRSKLLCHSSLQVEFQEDRTRYSNQCYGSQNEAAHTTTFKAVRCYRKLDRDRQPTGQQDHKFWENFKSQSVEVKLLGLETLYVACLFVQMGLAEDLRNRNRSSKECSCFIGFHGDTRDIPMIGLI